MTMCSLRIQTVLENINMHQTISQNDHPIKKNGTLKPLYSLEDQDN